MNHEDLELFIELLLYECENIPEENLKKAEQVMLQSELFTDRDYTEGVLKDVQTPKSR